MWRNSWRLEPAISPTASACWSSTPTPLLARTGFAHRARTRRQHPPANKAIPHYFSGAFFGRMSRVLKLIRAGGPVEELGLPCRHRGVVAGHAHQRVCPCRTRWVAVQAVLHELLIELGAPEQVEQRRIVEND